LELIFIEKIKTSEMVKTTWLVEVRDFYDKEWIVIDSFITTTPNKYKGLKYKIKKIKQK